MNKRGAFILTAGFALGACSQSNVNSQGSEAPPPLPANIALLAAPNQDLTTAFLRPEDNCFWYTHVGPVETTLLPLRSTGGIPICVKPAT